MIGGCKPGSCIRWQELGFDFILDVEFEHVGMGTHAGAFAASTVYIFYCLERDDLYSNQYL